MIDNPAFMVTVMRFRTLRPLRPIYLHAELSESPLLKSLSPLTLAVIWMAPHMCPW